VAQTLREEGFATLLTDLLTSEKEGIDRVTRHLRFDIELLVSRLVGATDWLLQHPDTRDLNIGYFGASTGAAAALIAATKRPVAVGAVVSRGGRPDLAKPVLDLVEAPILLIVSRDDLPVIRMNRDALIELRVEKKLKIVPAVTHLFQESDALEEVARLASQWFRRHFTTSRPRT
jgi:dienelactone hydrolase